MSLEILTEIFPHKEMSHSLRNRAMCRVEVLKLPCMVKKLYLVSDQKYGTFYQQNKKKKLMNGTQRVVHIAYVKRTYKTLDFCK